MSFPRSIRWLTLTLFLMGVLDLVFAMLGWTQVAVALTALVVAVPFAYLVHQLREAMASYGVNASEFGPSRPPRLPVATRTVDARPPAAPRAAVSRRLPDAVGVVQRVGVLLLITTTVVALRTVVAFEMLPH